MEHDGGLAIYAFLESFPLAPFVFRDQRPHAFGNEPYGGLVETPDGTLYGVTASSGPGGHGTLYKFEPAARRVTIIHNFTSVGRYPAGALALGADGNLYGATHGTDFGGNGSFYKLTDGVVSHMVSVSPPVLKRPWGDVMRDSGGGFWGSLLPTGLYRASAVRGLEYFDAPCVPFVSGPLIQIGSEFYGTAHSPSRVFRFNPSTPFACPVTLHEFSGPDGDEPVGGVMLANDGALWGTTAAGGWFDRGTVFRLTLGGTLTTMHHFTGLDGAVPTGTLVQGPDGNLYGTTATSTNGSGTVFRMSLFAEFTSLHAFPGGTFIVAYSGLTAGPDGAFYGTTFSGSGNGSVFRITSSGAFSTVHQFNGTNGANPHSKLTPGADGALYGTTLAGGSANNGTVYRIVFGGVD